MTAVNNQKTDTSASQNDPSAVYGDVEKELAKAIHTRDVESVKRILKESKPNFTAPRPEGNRYSLTIDALRVGDFDILNCLYQAGADFSVASNDVTPLVIGINKFSIDRVQWLVDRGVSLETPIRVKGFDYPTTALGVAVWYPSWRPEIGDNQLEIIKCLIENGANTSIVALNGRKLKDLWVGGSETRAYLNDVLAVPNKIKKLVQMPVHKLKNVREHQPELIEGIVKHNKILETLEKMSYSKQLVFYKVMRSDMSFEQRQKAEVMMRDNRPQGLLLKSIDTQTDTKSSLKYPDFYYAAQKGDMVQIMQQSFQEPMDLNERDGYGRTPLMWVAYHGMKDVFRYLVERGADVDAVDKEGATVAEYIGYRTDKPEERAAILSYLTDLQNKSTVKSGTKAKSKRKINPEREMITHMIQRMSSADLSRLPETKPVLFQKMITLLQLKQLMEKMPYEKLTTFYDVSQDYLSDKNCSIAQQLIRNRREEMIK